MTEIEYNLYDKYFEALEIDCIEQPIANLIGRNDKKGYLLYSLYTALYNNFYLINDKEEYFRNQIEILEYFGYAHLIEEIDEESALIDKIRKYIDKGIAAMFYTRRKYIFYEYKRNNVKDSIHLVMIIGYDKNHFMLVDNLFFDDSDEWKEAEKFRLKKIIITKEELLELWKNSATDDNLKKNNYVNLHLLEYKEEKKFNYLFFREILKMFNYESKFSCRSRNIEVNSLLDEEIYKEIAVSYCKSFKVIFKIIFELNKNVDKFILDSADEIYNNRTIYINKLLKLAIKNEQQDKGVLETMLKEENEKISCIVRYLLNMEF